MTRFVDLVSWPGCDAPNRSPFAEYSFRVAAYSFNVAVISFFDTNFGNYLFDAPTGRVALLDFGATESVTPERVEQLRELCRGLRAGDAARIRAVALAVGFIAEQDALAQTQAVLDMMRLAGEPLRQHGVYDFGASELFGRVFEQGRAQMLGEGYARTPPPDLLFLQRKFVGTFMLCSRLQARLDIGALFGGHL